jgi:hypothetical protein
MNHFHPKHLDVDKIFEIVVMACQRYHEQGTITEEQVAFINQLSGLIAAIDEKTFFADAGVGNRCRFILRNKTRLRNSLSKTKKIGIVDKFSISELREIALAKPENVNQLVTQKLLEKGVSKKDVASYLVGTIAIVGLLVAAGYWFNLSAVVALVDGPLASAWTAAGSGAAYANKAVNLASTAATKVYDSLSTLAASVFGTSVVKTSPAIPVFSTLRPDMSPASAGVGYPPPPPMSPIIMPLHPNPNPHPFWNTTPIPEVIAKK